jgi:hypothetical protein
MLPADLVQGLFREVELVAKPVKAGGRGAGIKDEINIGGKH